MSTITHHQRYTERPFYAPKFEVDLALMPAWCFPPAPPKGEPRLIVGVNFKGAEDEHAAG